MGELAGQIEAKWRSLTAGQRRVAEYVLANPLLIATAGLEELAQATGVSPASITRFVRAIGFAGYAEFRASALTGYQAMMRPVENLSRAREASLDDVVDKALGQAVSQLDGMRRAIDVTQLSDLATRMVEAGTVGFLGFGSSGRALVALANLSEAFCQRQILLDGRGGMEMIARRIARMGPQDLLIAMSLPRYSRATLDFIPLARACGVRVVAISDSHNSQLARICDESITIPADHTVLHSSTLGALALFETIAAILASRYDTTSDAATLTRVLMPYLYAAPDGQPAHFPEDSDR